MTPPFALVEAMSADAIAPALPAPTGTAAVVLTLQELVVLSGKNLSPQFTSAFVSMTTCLTPGTINAPSEFAPQLGPTPNPPSVQAPPLTSSFIEPDRSSRIRISGGIFV